MQSRRRFVVCLSLFSGSVVSLLAFVGTFSMLMDPFGLYHSADYIPPAEFYRLYKGTSDHTQPGDPGVEAGAFDGRFPERLAGAGSRRGSRHSGTVQWRRSHHRPSFRAPLGRPGPRGRSASRRFSSADCQPAAASDFFGNRRSSFAAPLIV